MFKSLLKYAFIFLVVPVVIVLLPIIIPLAILINWIIGRRLRYQFEKKWASQGKRILLVYSESPNWQTYIEENWLPRLQDHVVILNWSDRKEWEKNPTLESKILRHWGGYRAFNPLAVYFPKTGEVQTIRFYK
ncbi:MAG: hypothetical protein ACYTBZ_28325, partial [Planctomycetota bacterium]